MLTEANRLDVPEIVRLMNAGFRGTGPDAGWNTEAGLIAGDRTSAGALEEAMDKTPEALLLVCRDDRTTALQGCVWLEPRKDGAWYLGSLTVDPKVQNSGLGRSILASAEERARASGAKAIRMKVINVRDTLIAWYERRGYRATGQAEPFPYGDNRFGTPLRDNLFFVVLEKRFPG